MKNKRWLLAATVTVVALVGTGCGSDETSGPQVTDTSDTVSEPADDNTVADGVETSSETDDDQPLAATVGPNGESATPTTEITITEEQREQISSGDYTAALLWHTSSDFVNAVSAGATDVFDELGVEVIATTDAAFDSAQQQSDVETVMARNPSVILSLPVDPVSAAEAFQPAVAAGTELVFLSNVPQDYTQGEEYAGIVTDDLYAMGANAADALADALGGEGEIGYIFHDADYYVTNQRDGAFKSVIEQDYPNMEIVAEQGITDPAQAEEVGNAMITQNPDLDGVYVSWAEPGEGVVSALRAAGLNDVAVVTLDLSETLGLDMAQGGNVTAIVADEAYELGAAMARVGALSLLGEEVPPFAVAPAITVTADNLAEGWQTSLNRELPQSVQDALG